MKAQELASPYSGGDVTVNIYLFNEDHYIVQNRYDTQLLYRPTQYKPQGYDYKLTI